LRAKRGAKTLVLFHHDARRYRPVWWTVLARQAREEFDSVFAQREQWSSNLAPPTELENDMPVNAHRACAARRSFRAKVSGFTEGGHAFEEEPWCAIWPCRAR